MTKVDQFESVFRSAERELFVYQPPRVERVLVITDLDGDEAGLLADQARGYLRVLDADDSSWRVVPGSEYTTVAELLAVVEDARPDLLVTYRHLQSAAWNLPFTLGDHLEVLTQATTTPVLVLPHPRAGRAAAHAVQDTNVVMAITDHLTGDHRLVSNAFRFTEPGGRLLLSHLEDAAVFERMIGVISRISELDTDLARVEIGRRLLKEPADYIDSCRGVLAGEDPSVTIESVVAMGHRLEAYVRLVGTHEVDLLVFRTKDEDQLAMHGLAYALAVELRHIPLLML